MVDPELSPDFHKYHIVNFPADDTYEIIHSSWVKPYIQRKNGNTKNLSCYFPSGVSPTNLKKALKEKYKPLEKWKDKWMLYKVNIIDTIVSYKETVREFKKKMKEVDPELARKSESFVSLNDVPDVTASIQPNNNQSSTVGVLNKKKNITSDKNVSNREIFKKILDAIEIGETEIGKAEHCQKSLVDSLNSLIQNSKEKECFFEVAVVDHNKLINNILTGEKNDSEILMPMEEISKLFEMEFPISSNDDFVKWDQKLPTNYHEKSESINAVKSLFKISKGMLTDFSKCITKIMNAMIELEVQKLYSLTSKGGEDVKSFSSLKVAKLLIEFTKDIFGCEEKTIRFKISRFFTNVKGKGENKKIKPIEMEENVSENESESVLDDQDISTQKNKSTLKKSKKKNNNLKSTEEESSLFNDDEEEYEKEQKDVDDIDEEDDNEEDDNDDGDTVIVNGDDSDAEEQKGDDDTNIIKDNNKIKRRHSSNNPNSKEKKAKKKKSNNEQEEDNF